jgi:hypothetical protein
METLQEVAMRRILIAVAALALVALAAPGAASASHHGKVKAGDRNRDGIPDSWERQHHLSLRRNEARRDEDRDGLDNKQEFEHTSYVRQSWMRCSACTAVVGSSNGDEAMLRRAMSTSCARRRPGRRRGSAPARARCRPGPRRAGLGVPRRG